MSLIFTVQAQQVERPKQTVAIEVPTPGKTSLDAVKLLNPPKHLTGIQLIDNRFRIDEHTDEIVLVLFRKAGSPPVILIRPDGSKLYAPTITPEQGEWYDDNNYDMVRLKDPMVGPWQAVGRIEAGSRIMVVSDIQLEAEPLPDLLFVGETLKLQAYLKNGGQPIEYGDFSSVVGLEVTFTSTNNIDYDNFGADAVKVARFYDDGQGFDEKRKDGIFTGEFKLTIQPGEWLPSLFIDLGLFNRELLLDPIIINPIPLSMTVDKALTADQQHIFNIESASDKIDFSSFVFSGEVFYPNGEAEKFALTESSEAKKSFPLFNYADGIYRVKVSAFGKNINGRDLMLDVPEFTFNIAPAPVEIDESALVPKEEMEALPEAPVKPPEPEGYSATTVIMIAVFGNLFVLLTAFAIYWFVFKRDKKLSFKKINWKFWQRNKKAVKEMELPEENGVDKISTEADDIIDLTLPDET
ncbi:TIGR03503 family protein [Catenovulum sediminis]|uniref:TIGR03503 family protein n=1 Tax=Catenovulum sediminis TaxID=1740262 RepID=A0ABV1RC10_9ALTE|nr:TIGR03503 family protein [Catenovulum sediminis]